MYDNSTLGRRMLSIIISFEVQKPDKEEFNLPASILKVSKKAISAVPAAVYSNIKNILIELNMKICIFFNFVPLSKYYFPYISSYKSCRACAKRDPGRESTDVSLLEYE